MTWFNRYEILPPSDGVYEIGEVCDKEVSAIGYASYNGLEFTAHAVSPWRIKFWRYPIVLNVEKKYGKVK